MPNYFIVSTTEDRNPNLFLSQSDYVNTLAKIRGFEKFGYRHYFVFSLKGLPMMLSFPNVTPLALEAHIKPDDMPEYYRYGLGQEIESLPQEQALEELQKALDYLDKVRVRIEGRTQTQAAPTGT